MSQNGSGKIFAFIFLIIAVTAALFFFFQRQRLAKQTKDLLDQANKLATTKLPEPTPSYLVQQNSKGFDFPTYTPTPTDTPTPSTTPILTPKTSGDKNTTGTDKEVASTKGGLTANSGKKTTTRTITVCTPVYGMANSCAEHIVVDTGVDSGIFTNLALMSYVGGLVAFVKAKRTH